VNATNQQHYAAAPEWGAIASALSQEPPPAHSTPPEGYGWWLLCLTLFVILLDRGGAVIGRIRGKPTAEVLSIRLDEYQRRVDVLESRFIALADTDRAEHEKIYNRINAVAEGIARIEGAINKRRTA